MKKTSLFFIFVMAVMLLNMCGTAYSADSPAKEGATVLLADTGGIGNSSRFLIVPGRSVGLIEIGKPISQKVKNLIGKPANFTPPTTGKSGLDTGSYYWEDKLIVKINDGKNDMNVYQVFVMSNKYYTARGIRLGSTLAQLKKAYPNGKKVEMMDHDFGWQIPGMTFGVFKKKVTSMSVHPIE